MAKAKGGFIGRLLDRSDTITPGQIGEKIVYAGTRQPLPRTRRNDDRPTVGKHRAPDSS